MAKYNRVQLKNKLYKLTLARCDKKEEYYDYAFKYVKATDAMSVYGVAGDWIIAEEKKARKEGEEIFGQEIEMIKPIDIED